MNLRSAIHRESTKEDADRVARYVGQDETRFKRAAQYIH